MRWKRFCTAKKIKQEEYVLKIDRVVGMILLLEIDENKSESCFDWLMGYGRIK